MAAPLYMVSNSDNDTTVAPSVVTNCLIAGKMWIGSSFLTGGGVSKRRNPR